MIISMLLIGIVIVFAGVFCRLTDIAGKKTSYGAIGISMMAVIFSIFKIFTGEIDSLPAIAYDGQDNTKATYESLEKGFFNHDHYVHVISENKDINQISDDDAIGGINVIKQDGKNSLVSLTVIKPEQANANQLKTYEKKEEKAIMHNEDIKDYKNNIYQTYENIHWGNRKHDYNEVTSQKDKAKDIEDIKNLLNN